MYTLLCASLNMNRPFLCGRQHRIGGGLASERPNTVHAGVSDSASGRRAQIQTDRWVVPLCSVSQMRTDTDYRWPPSFAYLPYASCTLSTPAQPALRRGTRARLVDTPCTPLIARARGLVHRISQSRLPFAR